VDDSSNAPIPIAVSLGGIKTRVWQILDVAQEGDRTSHYADNFLLVLILLNVIANIFGTVSSVYSRIGVFLDWFEIVSIAIFTIEYIGRVWSVVVVQRFSHPLGGRLRFMGTPMAIIDLLAVLPFYLPFLGVDLRFVRSLRLFRLFRLAKLGRYFESLRFIGSVVKSKKEELVVTSTVVLLLLVLTSSAMYYAENIHQPDVFSDIPSTMWWAVATLTTVGYGDVYPITGTGKLLGAFVAILGIGLFALPTAILGSGFMEEVEQRKKKAENVCPHCGKQIGE
jgi:voltage-gated potassium channel